MQIPAQYIILFGGSYIHHCKVFIKIHVLSFRWYHPGGLIISLSTWFNTPYWFSVLTITIWSILLANCTVFMNWLIQLQMQNLFLFLETLAGYSGCCTCWISHKWMIDSPTLWQLKSYWSVRVPAHAGGYPRTDWQLNNAAVSTNLLIFT